MDKKERIASRAAKELKNGDVVNLGIGIPTLIPKYLPKDLEIILHSENGIIGTGPVPSENEAQPLYVTDAGGSPSSVGIGGCFIDSCTSFALIRGGHIDCTILGALEVDQEGNLSNWIIPGKKIAGMGGAMDLAAGAKKMIITMEHTAKGKPKILKKCVLPLTAAGCVDMIITEMAVFSIVPEGLRLIERMPGFTLEEIRAATEADFIAAAD